MKKIYRKVKYLQPEDSPLQRLLNKGPQALSNPELLAILLGKDVNIKKYKTALELANEIFQRFNIKRLSQANIGELDKIFGIGKIRAAQIQAIFELGRRLNSYKEEKAPLIEEPGDVFKLLGPEMQALKKEVVKIVLLDSRNRLIKTEEITKGSLNASVIDPREIFKLAIDYNASSIILVHNHPSGDPEPSVEDIKVTKKLISAGKLLGIRVLDHIIIGNNKFVSLKDKII